MIALRREHLLAGSRSVSAVTLNVSGSMSANTGVAPRRVTHPAVAKNVKGGQITSSSGLRSIAINASRIASVPEPQATAPAAQHDLALLVAMKVTAAGLHQVMSSDQAAQALLLTWLVARMVDLERVEPEPDQASHEGLESTRSVDALGTRRVRQRGDATGCVNQRDGALCVQPVACHVARAAASKKARKGLIDAAADARFHERTCHVWASHRPTPGDLSNPLEAEADAVPIQLLDDARASLQPRPPKLHDTFEQQGCIRVDPEPQDVHLPLPLLLAHRELDAREQLQAERFRTSASFRDAGHVVVVRERQQIHPAVVGPLYQLARCQRSVGDRRMSM